MCIFFLFKMSREQLVVQRARKSFQTGRTKPLEFRIHQLKSLLRFISDRRRDIAEAVKKDLGKVGQSFTLICCEDQETVRVPCGDWGLFRSHDRN